MLCHLSLCANFAAGRPGQHRPLHHRGRRAATGPAQLCPPRLCARCAASHLQDAAQAVAGACNIFCWLPCHATPCHPMRSCWTRSAPPGCEHSAWDSAPPHRAACRLWAVKHRMTPSRWQMHTCGRQCAAQHPVTSAMTVCRTCWCSVLCSWGGGPERLHTMRFACTARCCA